MTAPAPTELLLAQKLEANGTEPFILKGSERALIAFALRQAASVERAEVAPRGLQCVDAITGEWRERTADEVRALASPPRSEGVRGSEVQSEKVYLKTDPNALAARIGEIAGRCSYERDREAIIEAATYLRASAQASWMPIETAPMDGTEIIGVFHRRYDEDGPATVYGPWTVAWDGRKWRSSWDGSEVISSESDFGTEYKGPDIDPTHWMPLPGVSIPSADLGGGK